MPVGVKAAVATVKVVAQVGAQIVGEKAAVAPVGSPAAEKETACAVPETSVAVRVLETDQHCITDSSRRSVGLTAKAAVTVKVKLVVWVTPPPVPVTVIV